MTARDLQPFLRPIRWTIAVFVVLALLIAQIAPLAEWQRWLLSLFILLVATYWYIITQLVAPSRWMYDSFAYANIAITGAAIAVIDYLVTPVDFSPLFILVILAAAMLRGHRLALITATSSTLLTLLVRLSGGIETTEIGDIALMVCVYFVSAVVVSELSHALITRWQTAAAEAEEQRRETSRRNRELEGLHSIAQAFGNLEDADEAIRQVTGCIAQLLKVEICAMADSDPETGLLQGVPPGYGIDDDQIKSFTFPTPADPPGFHLESLQVDHLLFNDLIRLPPSLREFAETHHIRHFVAARLMLHGHPTGLIAAANKQDGSPFTEPEGTLLGVLAGQAAVVVENVRLYRGAQRNLHDITRLYAISSQLAVSSEPNKISERAVQFIADALHAPAATIALLNESTGQLEYSATVGVPPEALKVPFREHGIGMTVLHTGEPRFVEDALTATDPAPVTEVWKFRAMACVPIRYGVKALGTLYVDYTDVHVFSLVEKNMLAIYANMIAIGLQNAWLLSAEQRKSTDLNVLARLSRSLAETMDLEEIFRVVEKEILVSLPIADSGVLFVYEPPSGVLLPRASFGYDREIIRMISLRPGESVPGQVYQNNRPVLLNRREAIKEGRRSTRPDNLALLAAASQWAAVPQSEICAPVHTGGETLGAIVLDHSNSAQGFVDDDLSLLVAIADRVALAVRNAQLYEREQRRAAQLAVVNDLGHRISSILDLDELALSLVHLVRDKFGYRYVHLFINDPAKRETVLRAGAGTTSPRLLPGPLALKFDEGIVGWTAAHGETVWANDVSKEPRFMYHPSVPETRAELAVPLAVSTRVIGVLDIQSERLNAFDPADVTTLETLAGQLVVAIENARHYGEAQEQAHRDSLTQVYNHSYFLERLDEEAERAQRDSGSLSLIMLDVDHFKEYNDAYGHVVGDHVLSVIVQSMLAHVHLTDLVGRWGGEEFCIALLDTTPADAEQVAQRIRETLRATPISGQDGAAIPPPTVSQGIANLPLDAQNTAALIDLADAALYRAKMRGRDQVHLTSRAA